MAIRNQNSKKMHDRVPSYYVDNNLYPAAYTRNEWQTRTSRRIHDGITIDRNYGLDTVSDDINSSPYSSPYYTNGRYHTTESASQRGSSSSVQGIKRLISYGDEVEDFSEEDIMTSIKMWQGKQIKFKLPYTGRIVGTTLSLKNTEGCTGILSVYFSAKDGGPVLAEASIDLCEISMDKFDHITIYPANTVPITANPKGEIYVRLEIWDEISQERSDNPFNTGRSIDVAATGLGNHYECIYELGEKNVPVQENYTYNPMPNRPCMALVYNNYRSIPVNRIEESDHGASVSLNGYRYDIFCYNNDGKAALLIYDREMNKIIDHDDDGHPIELTVDGRATAVNLVQTTDEVQYVDGYSPLQRFKIGEWGTLVGGVRKPFTFPTSTADSVTVNVDLNTWLTSPLAGESGDYLFIYNGLEWKYDGTAVDLATYGITVSGDIVPSGTIMVTYTIAQGGTPADIGAEYTDNRPVIAPSLICKHYNRIYLSGFKYDRNLVQCSEIVAEGPDYNSFPYRFYVPDNSPLATSTSPITAILEYQSNILMIANRESFSLFTTNSAATKNMETGVPQQITIPTDGSGVSSFGDITNYRGTLYSFDPDEGIRRFNGSNWNIIPHSIDSYVERVDMTKPRKMWGYANRLYFNYFDVEDGKRKCLVFDLEMNYQQFPWFQDVDIPFCDVRHDDDYDLIGIHPDYPCIMKLYAKDTWKRLDSPIVFERHTKYLSLPGNASDMILKRVHNKVLANANRWWYFSLTADTDTLLQTRGKDDWYRMPCWDTLIEEEPVESPFPTQDTYELKSVSQINLPNLRIRAISVQEKIKCKTFRNQACLLSVVFEAQPRALN